MKLIQVSNVKWDCPENEKPPTAFVLGVTDSQYEEIDEDDSILSDLISDFYGWCHFGFEFEPYTGEQRLPDVDLTQY